VLGVADMRGLMDEASAGPPPDGETEVAP
jgi:hypothetical protein